MLGFNQIVDKQLFDFDNHFEILKSTSNNINMNMLVTPMRMSIMS